MGRQALMGVGIFTSSDFTAIRVLNNLLKLPMADFSSKKDKFDMKEFEVNYCFSNSPIYSSECLDVQHCDLLSNILEQKCMSHREIWARQFSTLNSLPEKSNNNCKCSNLTGHYGIIFCLNFTLVLSDHDLTLENEYKEHKDLYVQFSGYFPWSLFNLLENAWWKPANLFKNKMPKGSKCLKPVVLYTCKPLNHQVHQRVSFYLPWFPSFSYQPFSNLLQR